MNVYDAEYSTTDGEMWVSAGTFDSEGKARHALRGYAKAGNFTRIVERLEGESGTVQQLIEAGKARIR